MSEVITLDPVLKKLLDELPREDPDKPKATVWISWCEGKHEIPINEPTLIEFGPWRGPEMASSEIVLHGSFLGQTASTHWDEVDKPRIRPGDIIVGTVTVTP